MHRLAPYAVEVPAALRCAAYSYLVAALCAAAVSVFNPAPRALVVEPVSQARVEEAPAHSPRSDLSGAAGHPARKPTANPAANPAANPTPVTPPR